MKRTVKIFAALIFLCYIFVLVSLLLFRNSHSASISFSEYIRNFSNFIPLKTVINYITLLFEGRINASLVYRNVLGNAFLFAPMSIFLYSFFSKMRKMFFNMATVFIMVFSAEVLQLIFRIGAFDVDDFILNMLGAFVAFLIIKIKPINVLLHNIFDAPEKKQKQLQEK